MAYQSGRHKAQADQERQPLIQSEGSETAALPGNAPQYDSISLLSPGPEGDVEHPVDDDVEDEDDEIKKLQKKRLQEQGGWWGYLKGFLIFLPHIWPYNDRGVQLWLLVMIVSIVIERFLTVLIPRQLGIITDALAGAHGTGK
jgi:hypothetical protein